jgi:hypothetical protein
MNKKLFYLNIVELSDNVELQKTSLNSRRAPTHSIALFSYTNLCNINPKSGNVKCRSFEFWKVSGPGGEPEYNTTTLLLYVKGEYKGEKIYGRQDNSKLYVRGYPLGLDNSPIPYCGQCLPDMTIQEVQYVAHRKWGKYGGNFIQKGTQTMPYIHLYDSCYNCVGFSEDIIWWSTHREWNPRGEKNRSKYRQVYSGVGGVAVKVSPDEYNNIMSGINKDISENLEQNKISTHKPSMPKIQGTQKKQHRKLSICESIFGSNKKKVKKCKQNVKMSFSRRRKSVRKSRRRKSARKSRRRKSARKSRRRKSVRKSRRRKSARKSRRRKSARKSRRRKSARKSRRRKSVRKSRRRI